nr:immunoglobulin light chain junction region [Macaca mulatta]
CQHYYGTPYSF